MESVDDVVESVEVAAETQVAGTPIHLWIVGVLSLLWNAFGAFDYTMTNTRNAAYLANFPPGMMDYIDAFPLWVMAAWALGVWGALLGSVLLLLRSRFAVLAFAVSLLGLAGSTVYQLGADIPPGLEDMAMGPMTYVIWIIAIALLWYAWKQGKAGVLR
jgi:hypothetical protein